MGLFLQVLTVLVITVSLQGWVPLGCLEEERIALLHLKDSLNYPNGTSLPSWRIAHAHCCSWERIRCNSSTGRVTMLYLEGVRNEELGDWYLNASLFLPFQQLNVLYLWNNRIAGWVENKGGSELQKLSNLESLYLEDNSFNNSILSFVEGLPSLKSLYLSYNRLEGLIDLKESLSSLETLGLCDLNHLQELDMSDNDLSGVLPSCLPNLTSLQQLSLSYNHLKIPMSLSPLYNLSKLKSFYGSGGAFPKFLYHQFNLQSLDLTNIQIKGEFPNWLIENNTYLQELHLENCSLLGPFLLPDNSHVNLSFLSISMNHFQGQIPSEIGARLPGLEVLFMSENGFNGSIPFSLGNISLLEVLDLSNNSLQGQIPGWIGNMSSLEFLDLSRNNFSGLLPPRFGSSSKLKFIYLSRNNLQGPIAMAFYDSSEIFALDLSHNDLTGRIPEWIDRLSNLRFLLLSYNNLEGEIPIHLYRLDQLTLIDLSHNHLSESLDLSYNKLDGEIPPRLIELFSLEVFSVAHNNLSGKTPARVAQFATFEESCYKDNPFLCGEPLPKICGAAMPPSPTPTSTNNEDNGGFMDVEVFYVSFGVAYIMVLLVIGVVLRINLYWRRAWFHFIEIICLIYNFSN
uniref:Leucine-rich repeat-containing N-terminal plant-type domain-containing protein n=1 Tax=Populus trichocarpa TaxID=3694 RepID=A0A2K1R6A5_POPTR